MCNVARLRTAAAAAVRRPETLPKPSKLREYLFRRRDPPQYDLARLFRAIYRFR